MCGRYVMSSSMEAIRALARALRTSGGEEQQA
jgi:hypothetical protein